MASSAVQVRAKLPPALTRRAARVAAAAKAKHAEEANQIIQFIKSRSDDIAGAFWDVGQELAKLADPRMHEAVGYANLEMLCEDKLGLGITTARKLMAIAAAFPRADAIRLRQERSAALIELAGAKGIAPVKLLHGKVHIPGSHTPVDVTQLSANALKRIARDERQAHSKGKTEAAATSRRADAVAAKIEKALVSVPGAAARASVPRKKGAEALLHVTVPLSGMATLARVLREASQAKS